MPDITIKRKSYICHKDGTIEDTSKTETHTWPIQLCERFKSLWPEQVVSIVNSERQQPSKRFEKRSGSRQAHRKTRSSKYSSRSASKGKKRSAVSLDAGTHINEAVKEIKS